MRGFFRKLFYELGGRPQASLADRELPVATTQVRWTAIIQDADLVSSFQDEQPMVRAFITPQDAVDFQDEIHRAYKLTGRTYKTGVDIKTIKT